MGQVERKEEAGKVDWAGFLKGRLWNWVFGLGQEGAADGYSEHGSDQSDVLVGRSPHSHK